MGRVHEQWQVGNLSIEIAFYAEFINIKEFIVIPLSHCLVERIKLPETEISADHWLHSKDENQ